ncbi:anti-sigma factor family protein [Jatrophihabitans sp. YIM 134969]
MSEDDLGVAWEHAAVSEWDAAYVLGALTPADRRRYERHLDACARCRTAVAELSGLPGLLADVPLSQVVGEGPPDGVPDDLPGDLLPRLSTAVARGRRRSRVRYGALGGLVAAAAVVLALVAFWPGSDGAPGSGTPGGSGTPPSTVTSPVAFSLPLQAVVPNPLAVDVRLVSEPWGTRVDLDCRFTGDGGAPGPDTTYGYELYATNRAGTTMPVTSWNYGPSTTAEPVGTSKWPVDQIASVEVRTDDGTVLLRGTR